MTTIKKNRIDVDKLNDSAKKQPQSLIDNTEKAYFDQIKKTADIIKEHVNSQILMLAGPSASSKTTTANKIRYELETKGIHSVVISLDDFYLDRDCLPTLEDGTTDFESINTLDLEKIKECFSLLLKNHQSEFPLFDFSKGERSKLTREVSISPSSRVIIEGLHALNPDLVKDFEQENFLKLYISPNSNYVKQDKVLISARDMRLIRRLIRDYFHRSSSISNTMKMWVNVIAAEKKYILPFRHQADLIIDSTMAYEPNIYVSYFTRILKEEPEELLADSELLRITGALKEFLHLENSYLPEHTVLKEFVE